MSEAPALERERVGREHRKTNERKTKTEPERNLVSSGKTVKNRIPESLLWPHGKCGPTHLHMQCAHTHTHARTHKEKWKSSLYLG